MEYFKNFYQKIFEKFGLEIWSNTYVAHETVIIQVRNNLMSTTRICLDLLNASARHTLLRLLLSVSKLKATS